MGAFNDLVRAAQEMEHIASVFCRHLSAALRASFRVNLDRQESIIKVMCLLPDRYTYKQVNRALVQADIEPDALFLALVTGRKKVLIAQFYLTMEKQSHE